MYKNYQHLIGRKVLLKQKIGKEIKDISGGTLTYYGRDYWGKLIAVIDRCPIHIDNSHIIVEHPGYLERDPENDKKWIYVK